MSDETGAGGQTPEHEDATPATEAATAPPARRRGLRRGTWIGVVAAVVVVAAILIAVVAVTASTRAQTARTEAAASVSKYLTSVAGGDARLALGQLSDAAKLDRTLLTDAALAASNRAAPLTGIHVVTPATGDAGTMRVSASYRLGATPVTTRFDVRGDGAGGWLITNGTGRIALPAAGFAGLTLRVNGVAVAEGATLDTFPGTYTLGTSTPGFTIAGTDTVTVEKPSSMVSPTSAHPQLTAGGLQSYRFAIDRAVKGCISAKTLKAGCGLSLPSRLADGTKLVDGTVQRSLPKATLAKLGGVRPNVAASDGVKLVADGLGAVEVSVRCVKGGQKGTCQIANGSATYLNGPVVDISHRPPAVSWPAP